MPVFEGDEVPPKNLSGVGAKNNSKADLNESSKIVWKSGRVIVGDYEFVFDAIPEKED